jgi:hypothetical protein
VLGGEGLRYHRGRKGNQIAADGADRDLLTSYKNAKNYRVGETETMREELEETGTALCFSFVKPVLFFCSCNTGALPRDPA